MIRLERNRSKIPAAFRGQKRIEQALKLLIIGADGRRKFESDYWKKAKKQLKEETHGKCAYCEAPTENVAHGDVEHFRPKSIYWWLAYCYDNYLFSCQLCNQTFKKDSFPISNPALIWQEPQPLPGDDSDENEKQQFVAEIFPDPSDGTAVEQYLNNCRQEQSLLVNPYFDNPTNFFVWEADHNDEVVNIKPKPGNATASAFLDAVQQFYGLNRTELGKLRWKEYRKLSALVRSLESNQLDDSLREEVKDVIREMIADSAPYAGMCRYFVLEEWQVDL
jgi:hypothetical protein